MQPRLSLPTPPRDVLAGLKEMDVEMRSQSRNEVTGAYALDDALQEQSDKLDADILALKSMGDKIVEMARRVSEMDDDAFNGVDYTAEGDTVSSPRRS